MAMKKNAKVNTVQKMNFFTERTDIIIGVHSIVEAIKNSSRENKVLYATGKGFKELKNKLSSEDLKKVKSHILGNHEFNIKSEKIFLEQNIKSIKIPSGLLLVTDPLPLYDVDWMLNFINKNHAIKIFCLDQVTDVHNGAAILRTAAFFGVKILVMGIKGNFGITPAFYRISSGATEYVKIVYCTNLSKLIKKLIERGIECIGFAEDGHVFEDENKNICQQTQKGDLGFKHTQNQSRCLVFGAEDKGLSYAVKRVLSKLVAIKAHGNIKTLNVSVAAGIGMERYF